MIKFQFKRKTKTKKFPSANCFEMTFLYWLYLQTVIFLGSTYYAFKIDPEILKSKHVIAITCKQHSKRSPVTLHIFSNEVHVAELISEEILKGS